MDNEIFERFFHAGLRFECAHDRAETLGLFVGETDCVCAHREQVSLCRGVGGSFLQVGFSSIRWLSLARLSENATEHWRSVAAGTAP